MSLDRIKNFIKQEIVLCAAVLLAIVSSFFQRPTLASIDFGVLSVLLALMLVVAGLKSIRFLDWAAVEFLNKCTSLRQVNSALILITYISSMFVTNDVALITFVPLTLVIRKRLQVDMVRTIVLQTMAANLGSMVTPPGNPQNLFLYSHFHYSALKFFMVMAGPTLLALLIAMVMASTVFIHSASKIMSTAYVATHSRRYTTMNARSVTCCWLETELPFNCVASLKNLQK